MGVATGRRVLVAGGAGFIGSHLCDWLIGDGAEVICLDNFLTGRRDNIRHLEADPRFALVEHDVIEPLERLPFGSAITHIFNLACPASPPYYQADPEHTLLTNVMGTRSLLRLAERTGARLLLASTSEVYGDPEIHPQTEDYRGSVSCTGPRACYDEGKRAAETLAFDFLRAGRADVRIARIFNTYGPRMRADDGRVISNFVCQALSGEDITVNGDGTQTRSFCYVTDMVEALVHLMESEQTAGLPVNLGNPNELDMRELVGLVVALTGSKSQVSYRPLPQDDPRRRNPDISRAIELLGWRPGIGLEEGLRLTIAWFEDERNRMVEPAYASEPLIAAAE